MYSKAATNDTGIAIDNPFTPGAGDVPPFLAGREEILDKLGTDIKRLAQGKKTRPALLVGLRGTGKTALLRFACEQAASAGVLTSYVEILPHARRCCATLPGILVRESARILRLLEKEKRTPTIERALAALSRLAATLGIKLAGLELQVEMRGRNDKQQTDHAPPDIASELSALFLALGKALHRRKKGALFVVDEIHSARRRDLAALGAALHHVAQEALPLSFLSGGLCGVLPRLASASPYSERFFVVHDVENLTRRSSALALQQPAIAHGRYFTHAALAALWRQTRGFPFFVQCWGYHCWELAGSARMDKATIDRAAEQAIADVEKSFFRLHFARLRASDRIFAGVLAQCPQATGRFRFIVRESGLGHTEATKAQRRLARQGLIFSPRRGWTALSQSAFAAYLRRLAVDMKKMD